MDAQLIWNWFKLNTEITEIGIAAIMGNIQAESSFVPNIVQRGMGVTLSDAEYTENTDSGDYSHFVTDGVGYGLCQWTYWSRKQGLLNYCRLKGKSVGDYEAQLGYMLTESEWKSIKDAMTYATDLESAVILFCAKFENPAIQNNDTRYKYAKEIYSKYKGTVVSETASQKSAIRKAIELLEEAINLLEEGGDAL